MHSEKARKWFDQSGEERFFFCRFTQITVLRLLTTEKVMGTDVTSMIGAWDLWDRVSHDNRISLLSEPPDLEREFRFHSPSSKPVS